MTKKLTYKGKFKSTLFLSEILSVFPDWGGVTDEGTTRLESKPDGTEISLYAPDDADENAIKVIVDAHDYTMPSPAEKNEQDMAVDINNLKDKYIAAIVLLDDMMDNWDGWTGTEKTTWMANHFDEVALILKYILKYLKWKVG